MRKEACRGQLPKSTEQIKFSVRDSTLHRGFYQKSVVILTQLPFYNLYSHVIDLIAPEYFSKGEAALEAMAAAINRWPSPVAGFSLELPFLGSVLRVRLPSDGEGNTIRSVDSKLIPAIQPTPGTILIPHISDLGIIRKFSFRRNSSDSRNNFRI